MTPCPKPCMLVEKIPGAKAARFTACGGLVWPSTATVNVVCVCPDNSQGTWMLAWVPEAKNNGARNAPPN